MNVWCGVLGNKMIGPFVFDNNLKRNAYEVFLRNELAGLLENIPLVTRNQMYFQNDGAPPHTGMSSQPCYVTAGHSYVMYSAWNPKDNYDMSASVFVVQFNGFMSLTS